MTPFQNISTTSRHVRSLQAVLGLFVLVTLTWPVHAEETEFPPELVSFIPYQHNPVFTATSEGKWDARIRERGWILRDDDGYHMWYTGYDGTREGQKKLGYATSQDGLKWTRDADNPIYDDHWVEDMMIVRLEGTFYMFAEGKDDQAHLLRSSDGKKWKRVGRLDVRMTNGKPIELGPYGTPTAWHEAGTWYLFYERRDEGVWLATSKDMQVWTNVSDQPVLSPGPGLGDRDLIAMNQIVKHKGLYYAFFHGTAATEKPRNWSSHVAVSKDLVHWKKYANNPLLPIEANKSSGILVHDGKKYRLYTMHDEVHVHFPSSVGHRNN